MGIVAKRVSSIFFCRVLGLASLASFSAHAGRWLPAGEEAWTITRMLHGSYGEIHLAESSGRKSAFLRLKTGAVYHLKEVVGSPRCQDWFRIGSEEIPSGCGLIFGLEGVPEVEVPLDQVEERTIFHSVNRILREQEGHVSF